MPKLIALIILILNSISFASDCTSVKKSLESFLQSQENHCNQDSDCDGFYFRADSCARAIVLPKKIVSKSFESDLLKLQEKVRTSCIQNISTGPCGALLFKASCKNKKCVDLIAL